MHVHKCNNPYTYEEDTGVGDNFCTVEVWTEIRKPTSAPASKSPMDTLGTFQTVVSLQGVMFELC